MRLWILSNQACYLWFWFIFSCFWFLYSLKANLTVIARIVCLWSLYTLNFLDILYQHCKWIFRIVSKTLFLFIWKLERICILWSNPILFFLRSKFILISKLLKQSYSIFQCLLHKVNITARLNNIILWWAISKNFPNFILLISWCCSHIWHYSWFNRRETCLPVACIVMWWTSNWRNRSDCFCKWWSYGRWWTIVTIFLCIRLKVLLTFYWIFAIALYTYFNIKIILVLKCL